MAQQTINIGTGVNKGDGDALRTAFDKVNDNFGELYADITDLTDGVVTTNIIAADGSTVLVDGTNSTIRADNLAGNIPTGLINWDDINNTPVSISAYGITDAYTKSQVDALLQASINTRDFDLTGSVFADDSTLLVDGVNGKLVGDYENGTSTIGSTRVESYDIKAFQDTNTTDLYVANSIYGGETGTIKNVSIGSLPPSTSNGASGDRSGMIALDSSYIYYCTASYTDGVADIWKRVAWSGDTW